MDKTAQQQPKLNTPRSGEAFGDTAPSAVTRRSFTAMVATAFAAFIATGLGVPAIAYLMGPLAGRNSASWLSLGNIANFSSGQPKQVAVSVTSQDGWRQISTSRTVWVVPSVTNELVVFNGRCTHLGCAYSWQTSGVHANTFFCPCHEGAYDTSGTVLAGPPPRPLDRLDTTVVDGELFVLYRDFRLGVPTQEQA